MICIPLDQAADQTVCGGKAANLAKCIAWGFPVPAGFVIPRTALRTFLEENRFLAVVNDAINAYTQLAWPDRQSRFEALQNTALTLPIPTAVQAEIEAAFAQLLQDSPAGVAIRSSGVAEDLKKASFAGIYATFLGITQPDTFWQSVIRCWSSVWSPQAAAYTQKMGIELAPDGMAVLVQTLIPAESAGVIFTAEPATGNPWRFVLNATFGLAAGLVDGSAPADRFVLDWATGDLLERRVENKPARLIIQAQHTSAIPNPEPHQDLPSLTEKQVQQIGQLALAVDRAFDQRMDIEWATAGEQLYLLQARPITALPAFFPHELNAEDAAATWTPYLNSYGTFNEQEQLIAPFHRHRWLLELWSRHLTPDDVFPHRSGQERDFNGYRYTTEWQWQGGPPDWRRIERWLDRHEPHLRFDWLGRLEQVRQANAWLDEETAALQGHAGVHALDWLRLALAYEQEENQMQAAVWYAPQWLIFTCEELLKRFCDDILASSSIPNLPTGLLQGLSCYSVERTMAAQALGKQVEEDFVRDAFANRPLQQVLPFLTSRYPACAFLPAFNAYCLAYGMEPPSPEAPQGKGELDMEGVLLMIKTSLLGQGADAKMVIHTSANRRAAVEAQVRDWLAQNRPEQSTRFNKLLGWAQFWSPALDNRKWHLTMTVRIQPLYQRTAAALAAKGLVAQPDHFYLLTRQDWAAYLENPDAPALKSLLEQRTHEYERNRRLEPLAYLGKAPLADETVTPAAPDRQAGQVGQPAGPRKLFHGEGIAPGKVTGIAHKITLGGDDYLNELDQLTTQHIVICGRDAFNAQWKRDWYSLFMIVRGLVTVQGAQLHHASQIARECAVPFINLPGDSLEDLPDGQHIEIDGQAGALRVL